MKKLLILLFPLLLIDCEIETALEYYYELQYVCVPKSLKDEKFEYVRNDTTFIMQRDLNNLP